MSRPARALLQNRSAILAANVIACNAPCATLPQFPGEMRRPGGQAAPRRQSRRSDDDCDDLNPTNTRPAYQDAVARFSIRDAMAGLRGDLETGLNACVECCDRHAGTGAWRCAASRPTRC